MRILNLAIKPQYLDSVLSGRMVKEIREVRPRNRKYMLSTDKQRGNEPAVYDYISYKRKNDNTLVPYLVEVLRVDIRPVLRTDGTPVQYDYKGKKYDSEEVVFTLGKIKPMFEGVKMTRK